MKLSKTVLTLWFLSISTMLFAQKIFVSTSPNHAIILKVNIAENGNVSYATSYKNKVIIEPSLLGFSLNKPQISLN
jgi:hypothetical protein